MSQNSRVPRFRRGRILLVAGLACVALPSVASASAINLATAGPFAVLGGSAVTNTGPSVLDGELGVASGTALNGFGVPAVVTGTTHDDDAVAARAQNDLTTAYTTAAAQVVGQGNVLTGQDLGGLTLTPGAYSFASSAQLTGTLTLNAQGDPNAQFVFEIGSTLTTASASSVVLINGGSPCNVYWQVGSSATLGGGTAFQGNLMASTSITLVTGSSVQGRLLAHTGAVSLDDNMIDSSMCATASVPPTSTSPTPPTSTSPTTSSPAGPPTSTPTSTPTPTSSPTSTPTSAPGSTPTKAPVKKSAPKPGPAHKHPTASTHRGLARMRFSPPTVSPPAAQAMCNAGFTATVSGREIKRVVFTAGGRWLGTRVGSPFRIHVPPVFAHSGLVRARVTFKDATRPRTLSLHYRACAAAVVHPLPAPSTFTG